MTRFEHKHRRVRESELELALETADVDGWELVSAVSTTINYERGFDLFFKRPAPASDVPTTGGKRSGRRG